MKGLTNHNDRWRKPTFVTSALMTKAPRYSLSIWQKWKAKKSEFSRIGFYAVMQRTMPESVRILFRYLKLTELALLWLHSKVSFTKSLTSDAQNNLLNDGREELKKVRIQEAAQIFKYCLRKAPLNEQTSFWLTRTLLIQGNYLEAQKVLFRALAWRPRSILLRRQRAEILLATGAFWDAEAEYRKFAEDPQLNSKDALLALAYLSIGDARYEDAFASYRKVLNDDPVNISALLGIAECALFIESARELLLERKSIYGNEHWVEMASQMDAIIEDTPPVVQENHHPTKAVLVIDHFLPSTDRSAGNLRLFEIVKLIKDAGCHVTVIARNGEYQKRSQLQLEALGVETLASDPERLMTWSHKSNAEQIQFSQLLEKNNYVLAIVSRYQLASIYLPLLRRHAPHLPVAIDTVDVHFRREQKKEALYGNDLSFAENVKSEELAIYDQADVLITVSEVDAETLRKQFPAKPNVVVPLIYRMARQGLPFSSRKDLVFVGNFVHPPNSDALIYYCGKILPLLKTKLPGVKTYVVGANSLPLKDFANDDVIITGYVPRLEPFLNSCRINIAPLRYGAGTNGKILESLAGGLPVITTPAGAEGIADDKGLIISENPENFVAAIVRLYNDEKLWNSLRDSGLNMIKNRFTPEVVREKITELLKLGH